MRRRSRGWTRCGRTWESSCERDQPRTTRHAPRGPDVCGRVVARAVRQLRQAASYDFCPSIRAPRPVGGIAGDTGNVADARAALLFLVTAWALNPLCLALAPIALVFISAYSYSKRFTHWSHLWLGLADGIATPAGYLAVTGRWS